MDNLSGALSSEEELSGSLSNFGIRGYSAYEVAVLNGYVGTEAEWLESLKGKVDYSKFNDYRKYADQDIIDATKVDKEEGKGLSTNDFTDEYKLNVETNNKKISNVQADWDATEGPAVILNKPTELDKIEDVQVNGTSIVSNKVVNIKKENIEAALGYTPAQYAILG